MGKPKKNKDKAKSGLSSPKDGRIGKPNSHANISETEDEPELCDDGKEETVLEKSKEASSSGGHAGLIFMCNTQSKPECYRYRVFGLPKNREQVVMNIKRGAKLFLYDFDSKLLYGVYKASSDGGMDLEPDAFGGKYPAQVMFALQKDCLPVPESTFRHAIKENYFANSRFNIELNAEQVKSLSMLFKAIGPKKHFPTPAPVLLTGGPVDPLYPSPSAPVYRVENERVAAGVLLPPPSRQYPVSSNVLPPSNRQYPVSNVLPPSNREFPVGNVLPPINRAYPVSNVSTNQQYHVFDHTDLRSQLVPRDRVLHSSREYLVIPTERDGFYRPVVQETRYLAPVSAPDPREHVLRYAEVGIRQRGVYNTHPALQASYEESGRMHAAVDASYGQPAGVHAAAVDASYGQPARVHAADRRYEASLVPVSSRYSFAGSLPLIR